MVLGMGYSGCLGLLRCFGLRLCHRRHEGNQGIPDGLLHRLLGCAIEDQPIDNGPHDDPPANELPDGISHVRVVSP